MTKWRSKFFMTKEMPSLIGNFIEWLNPRGRHLARLTMNEYCEELGFSNELKAILLAQWGDYGLPPEKASAVIHMLIATHYLEGGYYPQGGSEMIPKTVQKIIEENGGKVLLRTEAVGVITENEQVLKVKVKHQDMQYEISGKQFFSDIGAIATYKQLLSAEISHDFIDEINNIHPEHSVLTLFLGFKESPEKLGFKGENHWIFETLDHDKAFNEAGDIVDGKLWFSYLSFPSLKDDQHEGGHTAEVITKIPYHLFEKWKESQWLRRDEEYKDFKQKLTDVILDDLDKRFPGFKDSIDFCELSTPLTYESMAFHDEG